MFQTLSLLPSSGKETPNMVDHLHRAKGSTRLGVPCLKKVQRQLPKQHSSLKLDGGQSPKKDNVNESNTINTATQS
jgi:hypothetical protein